MKPSTSRVPDKAGFVETRWVWPQECLKEVEERMAFMREMFMREGEVASASAERTNSMAVAWRCR